MFTTVMNEYRECIPLGDMNCNYLERSEHREIKSIVSNSELKTANKISMRITSNSKTLIGVIYSNIPEKIESIKVIPVDLSDSEQLECMRKFHSIKHSLKLITSRSYSNYDLELFCEDLEPENLATFLAPGVQRWHGNILRTSYITT